MGLVEDDQVPLGLLETREDVGLNGKVDGRHHTIVLDPHVLPEAAGDGFARDQREALAEALPHLPAPLVGEGLGAEHQDARHIPALHELAQEKGRP